MPNDEVDFSLLVRPKVPNRNFSKGDAIFREGDRGDEFFVIVRGEVEVRSGDRRLETLGPNSIFGEMALIDDSPRSATVYRRQSAERHCHSPDRHRRGADQGRSVSVPGQTHAVLRAAGDARLG
jgi:CRP-like cAMP-binding protein